MELDEVINLSPSSKHCASAWLGRCAALLIALAAFFPRFLGSGFFFISYLHHLGLKISAVSRQCHCVMPQAHSAAFGRAASGCESDQRQVVSFQATTKFGFLPAARIKIFHQLQQSFSVIPPLQIPFIAPVSLHCPLS